MDGRRNQRQSNCTFRNGDEIVEHVNGTITASEIVEPSSRLISVNTISEYLGEPAQYRVDVGKKNKR